MKQQVVNVYTCLINVTPPPRCRHRAVSLPACLSACLSTLHCLSLQTQWPLTELPETSPSWSAGRLWRGAAAWLATSDPSISERSRSSTAAHDGPATPRHTIPSGGMEG